MRGLLIWEVAADWVARSRQRVSFWLGDTLFRRLLQDAGWLLSGTVVATALTLGSTVIKARALDPELFGVLAVVAAYVAVVERLATFQPWAALIKYGAEALRNGRPDEFMGLVKVSLLLDLISAVSGTAIAVGGSLALAGRWGWDSRISSMAVVLSTSLLLNLSGTPTGILRLLDRFWMFTAQTVLTAGLGLAGAAAVYVAGGGIWGFLIVMLVSTIAGHLFLLAAGFLTLRQRGLWQYRRAPVTTWRPFLHFSGWTYAASTLNIPVRQLDIILVSALTSFETTGIYKIVKQVCALLTGLADPVYQAVYPQFAAMVASRQDRKAIRYAVRVGVVVTAAVGPAALVLAVLSPWWLGLVFGRAFAAGWPALSLFLALTALSLSGVAIHPLFTALGFVKEGAIVLLIANSTYLAGAWLLTGAAGLMGLAAAYGIQSLLTAGLKVVYIYRGRPDRAGSGVPVVEIRA